MRFSRKPKTQAKHRKEEPHEPDLKAWGKNNEEWLDKHEPYRHEEQDGGFFVIGGGFIG